MNDKYNHIIIEEGANFDTDYKVIESHSPDCPQCAYEQGIKDAFKWMTNNTMYSHEPTREFFLVQEHEIKLLNSGIIPHERQRKPIFK
jgi:hypothetical protein